MIKILFIKVNPIGTKNLFLDKEENIIEDARVKSAHRARYDIASKGAVSIQELHAYLESYKPNILHISGHGSDEGVLYFHDEENHKKEVPIAMFCTFIKNYKPHLKCVFMNACFSLMNADAFELTENQAIIGMANEVPNDTAMLFSRSFYTSLFGGKTISDSFTTAIGVVGIDGFGEEGIPVMKGETDLQTLFGQEEQQGLQILSRGDTDLVPEESINLVKSKRKKRKKNYYIIIGFIIAVSVALITTSYMSEQDSLYSIVGFLPLGLIKWIKDKLDGIEDSLMLLKMLETDINGFLDSLQKPPVENLEERVTTINQQFWEIVK